MYFFFIILFIGLVFRFLLIGNPGFLADVAFWKSWGLAALDHGIVWTAHNTNINYPPAFIYILWLMAKLYSFIGNPHNYSDFWRENNFGFLLASKSIAIAADMIIAILIYWFFSQKEKLKELGAITHNSQLITHNLNLPLLLSSIFFLNPIVILDSALWGQVESFGILFTLIAIILLFYKKPLLATIFFTTGTLMKLQNIIFIPIYFLFIFRYFDLKTAVKSLITSAATFFLLNLPFILAHDMQQVLYLMTINGDYFPWLSLNAHNLWWIKAAAAGMQITDRITVLGILNAKIVGLLIFSSFYFLCCLLVFLRSTPRNFLLSLTLSIFAFFLFTTQSHERYSYPVIVLLLFFYPFLENKSRKSYFWLIYALLTISIFFNIHTGLILNYPRNGFYLLTSLTTPLLTIMNSYVLIILFFLLLPFVFSQISYLFFILCSLFFAISMILLQSSYLFSGKVSLTFFKPIIAKQDYGVLQVNKSVDSSPGWKSWNRLSNNYFYYRKGFGTHANSELEFDINKKFKRFTTDYGVDTEANTPATIIFKIYGDGKPLFESVKMGRFDFPGHAEVNVEGVKHLKLVVNDAADGINSDHADWLNPVLFR